MVSGLSVIVVGTDKDSTDAIEDVLKVFADKVKVAGAFVGFHDAMKVVPTANADMIILEVKEIDRGVQETSLLVSRFPNTAVVVTSAQKNPDWILRLIRAGAREFLVQPVAAADVGEMLGTFWRLYGHREGEVSKKGTVISVYNPCGGMGTTTIAVNLAATLAAKERRVALLDLNFLNGDIPTFLDLAPRYTVSSVMEKLDRVDGNFLRSVMVAHSSGTHVMCGPVDLWEANRIVPEQLQEMILLLQRMFRYIVIDTGGQLAGCNQGVFEYSDHILYNTVLNMQSIGNAKRYLSAIECDSIGAARVKLVVNRHIPKGEMAVDDAENILQKRAYQVVPNSYGEARTSVNRGTPLIACYPRSSVTAAIDELAEKVMYDGQPGKHVLQDAAARKPALAMPSSLIMAPTAAFKAHEA